MICGIYLLESDWEEGYTCCLSSGHSGPHRDTGTHANNESKDIHGRHYEWAFEWKYDEADSQNPGQASASAANSDESQTVGCPEPQKCAQGPAPHTWNSDCERIDEGWNLDV